MSEFLRVVTTVDAKDKALAIASSLVEKRLAACGQVSGPIESTYWWQGMVEWSTEWQVTFKTTREVYPQVEAAIRALHPYQVPQIIAMAIVAGGADYLDWVREEVTPRG